MNSSFFASVVDFSFPPVETVEPYNDLSLESWTGCPVSKPLDRKLNECASLTWHLQAFEKHIEKVHNSDEFKKKAGDAEHFFSKLKDFTFGRPTTLENIVSFPWATVAPYPVV